MSKQTALDWYWDKIKSHFEHDGDLFETASFTFAIAKKKEREQRMEAQMDMFYELNDLPYGISYLNKRADAEKFVKNYHKKKSKKSK